MSHGGTTFKWGLMCGSLYICLVFALLILEQKGVCVLAPFPKFILLWTRVIQTAFSHLALILDKHFQYARHLTMLEEDSSPLDFLRILLWTRVWIDSDLALTAALGIRN